METLRTYYRLTKPGIIYGNLLTATGGFLLASAGHVAYLRLLALLIGTGLVIGSACVCNNYIDRNIDKKMSRTKHRSLALGSISGRNALLYSLVLGCLGLLILVRYTSLLTAGIGLFGLVAYIVPYSIAKRRTVHGTLVGCISGAVPPVAGYACVTGSIDAVAVILFIAMVCWQMAHFTAISIYRQPEYASAEIPVISVKYGLYAAKKQIIAYIVAYGCVIVFLSIQGATGYSYAVVMSTLALLWLRLAFRGFQAPNENRWARQVFGFSLLVITMQSVMLGLGPLLV